MWEQGAGLQMSLHSVASRIPPPVKLPRQAVAWSHIEDHPGAQVFS